MYFKVLKASKGVLYKKRDIECPYCGYNFINVNISSYNFVEYKCGKCKDTWQVRFVDKEKVKLNGLL